MIDELNVAKKRDADISFEFKQFIKIKIIVMEGFTMEAGKVNLTLEPDKKTGEGLDNIPTMKSVVNVCLGQNTSALKH